MSNIQKFREDISRMKAEVEKYLGKRADRFVRTILSYTSKNPKLLEVDQKTFLAAMMEVAALDLEVGMLGQADIIPFKGKAQLIIGYQGYITLIYRSGMVKSIFANVVRKNDKFSITYGSSGKLTHKPALDNAGEIIGAYGYAELITGGKYYDYKPLIELERIRKYSQMANGSAWNEETEWMYRKTMIRQIIKLLPKFNNEAEILKAIKIDEAYERDAVTVEDDLSLSIDYSMQTDVEAKVQEAKKVAETKVVKKKISQTEVEVDPIIEKIKKINSEKELKEFFSNLPDEKKPDYLDHIAKRNSEISNKLL